MSDVTKSEVRSVLLVLQGSNAARSAKVGQGEEPAPEVIGSGAIDCCAKAKNK